MTLGERVRGLPVGAEIAAAFAAGAGSFAVAAVALASVGTDVRVALVGVVYLAAVVAIARRVGIVYAVPVAMAGLLAFDWYTLPPTHALEIPDSANLADVIVNLTVAVLLGELAAEAARRARAAERARAEIADEQAALRRVATLVAQSAPAGQLFAAVAAEAGELLDVDAVRIGRYDDAAQLVHVAEWSSPDYDPPPYDRAPLDGRSVAAEVLRTGRAARIDDYEDVADRAVFARDTALKSVVGAPVVVDDRLWGVMVASSGSGALPAGTEARLSDFAELVATAISNTEARTRTARLADEQAALRRVATLVASGGGPDEIFAAVADEIRQLVGNDLTSMFRCEPGEMLTLVAVRSRAPIPDELVGKRLPMRRPFKRFLTAGHPIRLDARAGELWMKDLPEAAPLGLMSALGVPIVVGGRPWGAIFMCDTKLVQRPQETELSITQFTELLGTAIANAQARDELNELAQEQAALRRVATLVARGTLPGPVFQAVADEVGELLGADTAAIVRFEQDGTATMTGTHQTRRAPGTRFEPAPEYVVAAVRETGQAARFDTDDLAPADVPEAVRDEGIRSALGSPIVVEGELWGAVTVWSIRGALPSGTERRLADFTELMATAIANTESRARVQWLTEEQVALRRVATLVAKEASLPEVFARVAKEASHALGNVDCGLWRDEGDGTATLVAVAGGRRGSRIDIGMRHAMDADSAIGFAHREGRPGRVRDYSSAAGSAAERARELGIRSSLVCPVFAGERAWGAMQVVSYEETPIPPETETRIARFSDLVATAIANAEARAEVQRLADEQAALRRVATLVAQDVPATELFDAVAREMGAFLGGDFAGLARFEDGFVIPLGVWAAEGEHPPVPSRWPMQEGDPATTIARAGEARRWNDWSDVPGPIAAFIREIGVRSSVGTPIIVEGRLWGALALHSKRSTPFASDTEPRMQQFTDLVGTAIANAQARSDLSELVQEQASLRRVATLVARGAGPDRVFDAAAGEVADLLGTELSAILRFEGETSAVVMAHRGGPHPSGTRLDTDPHYVVGAVRETGRSARFDTDDPTAQGVPEIVRALGLRSGLASPVVVEGELWGAITVASLDRRLQDSTERRLAAFTELIATAVANTQARTQVRTLADEQTALRRVATLVAQAASAEEVLTAIAEECARLFGIDDIGMVRYEGDELIVLAITGAAVDAFPVGTRQALGGENAASRVFRTGAPVRIEDYAQQIRGPNAEPARSLGLRSVIGIPINVEGRLWGAMIAGSSRDEPLPPEFESRLGQFTELMGTAVANTESRARADRLADEQAALRRVATLVAKDAPPHQVFAKVAEEIAQLLGDMASSLWRSDGDGTATLVAVTNVDIPLGTRLPIDGDGVIATVLREGRAHWSTGNATRTGAIAALWRELGNRSAVGCPIVVGGRVWGALGAARSDTAGFPPATERRMTQFADLVATAVANADARAEIARLADEQAALRRVATLVAQGADPTTILDAVAGEIKAQLAADRAVVCRYEAGAELTVLAYRDTSAHDVPAGIRMSHAGDSVENVVRDTERSARIESYEGARGIIAELAHAAGLRVAVAAPVVVDGRLWGVVSAGWNDEQPPPADTEHRMAQFAQLLATAIANADSRDQLTASRARLLTTADEARRRVARDLHDGAQQRLVHAIVTLKLAQQALRGQDREVKELVGQALEQATRGNEELRELAHGILPSVLTTGGLRSGVRSLATRLDVPVRVTVPAARFAGEVEASAYFVVAEALTNVVKHAQAEHAEVTASADDATLRVEIRDDGRGGADPGGHGLVGMADRVTALGGRLEVESAPRRGTRVTATFPL